MSIASELDAQQRATFRAAWRRGDPVDVIADTFGWSRSTTKTVRVALGLPPRRDRTAPPRREKVQVYLTREEKRALSTRARAMKTMPGALARELIQQGLASA